MCVFKVKSELHFQNYAHWQLGLDTTGIAVGFKKYGIAVEIISVIAFYIGLQPFDYHPTIWKILIEWVIYYVDVAFIEELYVMNLLLNLIEKLFTSSKSKAVLAVHCPIVFRHYGDITI